MKRTLIRGGTVVDGTGGPVRTADVLVEDGIVTDVGRVDPGGAEVVDADGLAVTPGWVDVHTHYDGQVFWDPLMTPSSWNGVTTVVMGNCGVGFAPVRPGQNERLVELMTKIEDIPSATLRAGVPWTWETFDEYLDCLDATPRAIDVGTFVPHGAVRSYVMDERSRDGIATPDEIAEMVRIVESGLRSGALGCSVSRTTLREVVPGTFAEADEYLALGRAVGAHGRIFQMNAAAFNGDLDRTTPEDELELLRDISLAGNCPLTFSLVQHHDDPDLWRRILAMAEQANAAGAQLFAQVLGRPLNVLMSLEAHHPFEQVPAFREVAEGVSLPELVVRLADPDVRARILAEAPTTMRRPKIFDEMYPLTDPPDYAPAPETSVAAVAAREGRTPPEVYYDRMLEDGGRAMFLAIAANYAEHTPDTVLAMLQHPLTIAGIGDGGAHCMSLCDATTQTTIMTQWVRDRTDGPRLPLERAVHELTLNPARHFGLHDRGCLEPGRRADMNLIDLDALQLHAHEFIDDLPAGGRRMAQRASGYVATYVAGERILEDGVDTGARPGRTLRAGAGR